MEIKVGIVSQPGSFSADGWRMLCEQEKTPFTLREVESCPVLVLEGAPPSWMGDYMENGGVAVITGAQPETLPFPNEYICEASLEYADLGGPDGGAVRVQCVASVFAGEGAGKLRLHENRVLKNGMEADVYPAFVRHTQGKGGCWYTGLPLSRLLTALGDGMRPIPGSSGFSERMASLDRAGILAAMRQMLIRAFAWRGLPYVHLNYYPEGYRSAFAFRVDVDGVFGDNTRLLSRAAAGCGMRLSFYVNKALCAPEGDVLEDIDPLHEIGNHADTHNLYTSYGDNLENVRGCQEWLESLPFSTEKIFVAPRGMFNPNLGRALGDLGFLYSSDFGYCIYGFPLYPYHAGERMNLLQLGIDPFSTERAFVQAADAGREAPDAQAVLAYFSSTIRAQYAAGKPAFLYSHPQRFGPMAPEVLPGLKKLVDGLEIWQTTLTEFAHWWIRRDKVSYRVEWDTATGTATVTGLEDGPFQAEIVKGETA